MNVRRKLSINCTPHPDRQSALIAWHNALKLARLYINVINYVTTIIIYNYYCSGLLSENSASKHKVVSHHMHQVSHFYHFFLQVKMELIYGSHIMDSVKVIAPRYKA